MKDLLDKISSYNIFNYLFPGAIFCFLVSKTSSINLIQDEIILGAFIYYFIGLIISRFGSLVIEPLLRKIQFLKFIDYSDFVKASKNDKILETLSEVNNTYRTLISLILLLITLKTYLYFSSLYSFTNIINYIVLGIGLLLLFLFSYKKQTNYIFKRTKANLE